MIIKHASSFSAPFNSLLYLPSLDDNSQHGRHGRDCGKRKVRGTDHENHPHHFSYWVVAVDSLNSRYTIDSSSSSRRSSPGGHVVVLLLAPHHSCFVCRQCGRSYVCGLALGRFPLLLVQLTASTPLMKLGLCLFKVCVHRIYG